MNYKAVFAHMAVGVGVDALAFGKVSSARGDAAARSAGNRPNSRRMLAMAGVSALAVATVGFTIAGGRQAAEDTGPAAEARYAGAEPEAPATPEALADALSADADELEALLGEGGTQSLEPALQRLESGEYEKARWLAEPVANSGDPAAQHLVGYLYETGLGGVIDAERAEDFYRRSAEAGHVDGQVSLALLYLDGVEGGPQPEKAAFWLRRAAEKGDVRALSRLAALYTDGLGVPKDRIAGLSLFERAAAQGDPDALFFLGLSAMNGDGVPQDFAMAQQRLEAATAAGHVQAAYNLAVLYRSDALGRPKTEKAAIVMKAAADAGYPPAMTAMGLYAHRGEAEGRAADWFEKASEAGDLQGRFLYAVSLAQGDGRKKDPVRARRLADSVLQDPAASGPLKGNIRRFLQSLAEGDPMPIGALRE